MDLKLSLIDGKRSQDHEAMERVKTMAHGIAQMSGLKRARATIVNDENQSELLDLLQQQIQLQTLIQVSSAGRVVFDDAAEAISTAASILAPQLRAAVQLP